MCRFVAWGDGEIPANRAIALAKEAENKPLAKNGEIGNGRTSSLDNIKPTEGGTNAEYLTRHRVPSPPADQAPHRGRRGPTENALGTRGTEGANLALVARPVYAAFFPSPSASRRLPFCSGGGSMTSAIVPTVCGNGSGACCCCCFL